MVPPTDPVEPTGDEEASVDDDTSRGTAQQRFTDDAIRLDDVATASVDSARTAEDGFSLEDAASVGGGRARVIRDRDSGVGSESATVTVMPNIGPIGGFLDANPNRVNDIVGRLDDETIDELFNVLRRATEAVGPEGAEEERWRRLHNAWTSEAFDEIVAPALDQISDVRDDLRALFLEAIEEPPVEVTRASVPERELKSWGALIALCLGSLMGGAWVGMSPSLGALFTVMVGVVTLYGLCWE
jgi:hypothetical protein